MVLYRHTFFCLYATKKEYIYQIKKGRIKDMAYSAKSQLKYQQKCDRYTIKYVPSESHDSDRLKQYLMQSGQSANAYIKSLIKNDLDSRGFNLDTDTDNNDDIPDSTV